MKEKLKPMSQAFVKNAIGLDGIISALTRTAPEPPDPPVPPPPTHEKYWKFEFGAGYSTGIEYSDTFIVGITNGEAGEIVYSRKDPNQSEFHSSLVRLQNGHYESTALVDGVSNPPIYESCEFGYFDNDDWPEPEYYSGSSGAAAWPRNPTILTPAEYEAFISE